MSGNRHGMTGAELRQPVPAPLRIFAMFDRDSECTEHSPAFTGSIPCTGAYACALCGTAWDEKGNVEGKPHPGQQTARQRLHRDKLRHDLDVAESLAAGLLDQYHTALGKVTEIRHDLDTHDSLVAITRADFGKPQTIAGRSYP